jgi:hypothetical protein
MAVVTLVHPQARVEVSSRLLVRKSDLFADDPTLANSPYTLKSRVSLVVFWEFMSALEGTEVAIKNDNFGGLSQLSKEFGFQDLATRLSRFRDSGGYKEEAVRLSALEDRVDGLEALAGGVSGPAPTQLETDVRILKEAVAALQAELRALKGSSPSKWNSAIVPDFPTLFDDFKTKQITLLWRGSRDGFGAKAFHSRCDGHPNTLTVILDTQGNIFGGFTPVKWESCFNRPFEKPDWSGTSFLFTLKNPHNVPPRKFKVIDDEKEEAIQCNAEWGPHFSDIWVLDNPNTNTDSSTDCFGFHYTNDTGLDGKILFTGSPLFKVKEIEVFEISD